MLAQKFKSAKSLGMTKREKAALVAVLGKLERNELVYVSRYLACTVPNGFNMAETGRKTECGTVACIAGWAEILLGHWISKSQMNSAQNTAFGDLIMPPQFASRDHQYTPERAAIALRNYLTHGEPNWAEALSRPVKPKYPIRWRRWQSVCSLRWSW